MNILNSTENEDIESSHVVRHLEYKSNVKERKEYYVAFFKDVKGCGCFTYDPKLTLFDVLMLCKKYKFPVNEDRAKELYMCGEYAVTVV